MHGRGWRYVLIVLSVALFVAVPAGTAAARGARKPTSGSLVLVVTDVPRGAHAHVDVRGPGGFHRTVTGRKTTLARLRPGVYRVKANPFTVHGPGVPAGSRDFASPAKLSATIRTHHRTTVNVRYGNVISSQTRVAPAAPVGVVGPATNPTALVLPSSANVHVGQIIYYPPSSQFPNGVFSKVTGVSPHGGQVTVSLVPASLSEAFPEINVSTVIPIGNPPGAAADGLSLNPIARAADIKVSVSHGEFSCGSASPTLDLPLSLSPSLDAEIHKPLFGNLTVKFVIGINGSLGLHLVVPEGAGCDVTLGKLGPWPIGVIPIGPIEIPVSAELEGKASLTLDGPLTISANASLTSHAGFTYANGHLGGVFDATPSGNATVDFHGGNFQIGPELKISAGLADALDANVSAGLFDTLKGSSASAWGLGLTFSVEAGLEAEGIGSLSTTVADKYFPLASYGIPGE